MGNQRGGRWPKRAVRSDAAEMSSGIGISKCLWELGLRRFFCDVCQTTLREVAGRMPFCRGLKGKCTREEMSVIMNFKKLDREVEGG